MIKIWNWLIIMIDNDQNMKLLMIMIWIKDNHQHFNTIPATIMTNTLMLYISPWWKHQEITDTNAYDDNDNDDDSDQNAENFLSRPNELLLSNLSMGSILGISDIHSLNSRMSWSRISLLSDPISAMSFYQFPIYWKDRPELSSLARRKS